MIKLSHTCNRRGWCGVWCVCVCVRVLSVSVCVRVCLLCNVVNVCPICLAPCVSASASTSTSETAKRRCYGCATRPIKQHTQHTTNKEACSTSAHTQPKRQPHRRWHFNMKSSIMCFLIGKNSATQQYTRSDIRMTSSRLWPSDYPQDFRNIFPPSTL